MDELGLALVEESILTLRAMLRRARQAKAQHGGPEHLVARSVAVPHCAAGPDRLRIASAL